MIVGRRLHSFGEQGSHGVIVLDDSSVWVVGHGGKLPVSKEQFWEMTASDSDKANYAASLLPQTVRDARGNVFDNPDYRPFDLEGWWRQRRTSASGFTNAAQMIAHLPVATSPDVLASLNFPVDPYLANRIQQPGAPSWWRQPADFYPPSSMPLNTVQPRPVMVGGRELHTGVALMREASEDWKKGFWLVGPGAKLPIEAPEAVAVLQGSPFIERRIKVVPDGLLQRIPTAISPDVVLNNRVRLPFPVEEILVLNSDTLDVWAWKPAPAFAPVVQAYTPPPQILVPAPPPSVYVPPPVVAALEPTIQVTVAPPPTIPVVASSPFAPAPTSSPFAPAPSPVASSSPSPFTTAPAPIIPVVKSSAPSTMELPRLSTVKSMPLVSALTTAAPAAEAEPELILGMTKTKALLAGGAAVAALGLAAFFLSGPKGAR